MYALESGAAWTPELKDAFKHNVTRASVLYNNVNYNEDNFLKEAELQDVRYVPNVGFLGQAVAKMLTIKLVNDEDSNLNFENANIQFKMGAEYNGITQYINFGNFIVNEPPENDDTNGTVKVIAYDYMIKFNKSYINRVVYPCTLKDLLLDVCSQAGVDLGSNTFLNENFIVEDNQFEGKQLREVLQHIAKSAFSWARIGQDNKLYLDFQVNNNIDETITIDEYKMDAFKKANEYYGPINKVTYADSDIKGQEISVQDDNSIATNGVKEIIIYDNYFAYTTEKRQQLIQAGTALFGLRYMPIQKLETIGLIYLDSNDIMGIEDGKGTTFLTRNFSHIIKYNGITNDTFETTGESDNQRTYVNQNNSAIQNAKTEIVVDRAKKQIAAIVEEIGDRSQKTTTITADIDGLNSKVENIEDLTNEVSGLKTITLENCVEGNLLELHIYGNNTVFKLLYPLDTLYPSNILYPYGDSRIEVTDSDNNTTIYELGITEVLRQNGNVKDEYILQNNQAKVIRRIASNGEILENEIIEDLGELYINLAEGTNIITIKNYSAQIKGKFAIKSDFTEVFATKVEMSSSITQTAEEINLEVRKKVNSNEVISKINQSAEAVGINANKINLSANDVLNLLSGNTINLSGKSIRIASNNFSVDENGKMTCSNANISGSITSNDATITGGKIKVKGGRYNTDLLRVEDTNGEYLSYLQPGAAGFVHMDSSYRIDIAATPSESVIYVGAEGRSSEITDSYVKTPQVIQTSLESQKKNFEKYTNALETLKDIDIYKYNLKSEKDGSKKHIGFVIGRDFKYSEEITSRENAGADIYSFVSLCCQAIKEQQEEIEKLRKEINK